MTNPSNPDHDKNLANAFDGQAGRFEKAPVQTDPVALARLVKFADLPPGSRILDAGCGPGLVSRVFIDAGNHVTGVDLSATMIERARIRCPEGDFHQGSLYDDSLTGPFDASVSRYVLHHVADPRSFLKRQFELIRPGGLLILSDHLADPDPTLAKWHNEIEVLRDRTHTANLSGGDIVDLFAATGLEYLSMMEEQFTLDFDEWFDRGTPLAPKAEVRDRIINGPATRGFAGRVIEGGRVEIFCRRVVVRGVKP